MSTNTSESPEGNDESRAILNGIYNAYTVEEFGPRSGCFPSGEALVRSLHSNLFQALNLTRDVFLSSWDLLLLDHSHGILGGGSKKLGFDEVSKPGSPAQKDIEFILGPALTPSMEAASGFDRDGFFVPTLTMPFSVRMAFAKLSERDRLVVAIKTKRVFVNGERCGEYGGNGLKVPDAGFWRSQFHVDEARSYSEEDVVYRSGLEFPAAASLVLWLERCIERDGGDPHFVELFDEGFLIDDDDISKGKRLRAFALEMGMDRKPPMFGHNRHGAVPAEAIKKIGLHLPVAKCGWWNDDKTPYSPDLNAWEPFLKETKTLSDGSVFQDGDSCNYNKPVALWARDLPRILIPKIGELMSLTRDVFISGYDLFELDDLHGVLGGIYRDTSSARRDEALEQVRYSLYLHGNDFLEVWYEGFVALFLPSLTMSQNSRVQFDRLTHEQKYQIALKTKRIFVNGDEFHGYGGSGLPVPDEDFWPLLLAEPCGGVFTEPMRWLRDLASDLFWFERCIDLQGGKSRFIDHVDPRILELLDLTTKGMIAREIALRAYAEELGMY